jgi:hypothetical protein
MKIEIVQRYFCNSPKLNSMKICPVVLWLNLVVIWLARQNVASKINKEWTPNNVFMLYFAAITALSVETNRYYKQ